MDTEADVYEEKNDAFTSSARCIKKIAKVAARKKIPITRGI